MRILFLIMVMMTLMPRQSVAQLIQKNDRNIYDVMWLPDAGTIFGSTDLSFSDVRVDVEVAGDQVSEYQTSTQLVRQVFGYSPSNYLSFQFQIPYLLREKFTNEPISGDHEISERKGSGDPSVEARLRILDQANGKISLDLVPRYQKSTGEREDGDTDKRGNNKEGGDTAGIRLELGRKFASLQWMGFVGMARAFEAKSKSLVNNERSTQEQYDTLEAGLKIIGFIDDHFLLQGSVTHSRDQEHRIDNKTNGNFVDISELKGTIFGGGLAYIYSSNLLLSANFDLGATDDYEYVNDTGLREDYVSGTVTVVTLQARYQF